MGYREQLEDLIAENQGLIFTKEVERKGIPRHYLTLLMREGKLERVANGTYVTSDALEDEMYILQVKRQRVIFSHETALNLYDLTDRIPLEWSVTVPYGYNGTNLRKSGIQVYTVKRSHYLMGVTEAETIFGRKIKTYNKERTICDIARNRHNMDVAVLNEAIRRYSRSSEKNIPQLLRYAKELGVQKIVRNYMEMFL
ncbi:MULTISPECIES: type IV toxin-antitoxin system AbiEi family antitoxin domain-containing protein [Bacillaceae]|uniref:Type IV toxin-antitoxin system AbiEi family antitoxin domain-containing protein n=1 Tax=Evansella alkalicola TaxID=745819 RepID=A0ABS6JXK7_9BACI|nr:MULTISPECIES: type IV toxin-antitoxin system AbiEi family antitoxin domain-containing protein [Bacillaceae]MBU9723130.1 type IV toxin-antitoxin system AbiEi family antitoxin domain-containing protein [Bacillus alkalicola]